MRSKDVYHLANVYGLIKESTHTEEAEGIENVAQQVPGQLASQAGMAVNTLAGQMNITPDQQKAIQNLLTAFNVPTGSNIGKTVENLILKMVHKP